MKTKAKSIFRTGALKFISLFVLILASYINFYMDHHLAKTIKYAFEKINGAQVDVLDVKTKIFNPSISIKNIAFTNKKNPGLNSVEIMEVLISLEMKALLQAKFVINEIKIEDVQIDSKRKTPGEIFPIDDTAKTNKIKIFAENEIEKLGKKNQRNAIGILTSLIEGKSLDDTKDAITNQLQSEKEIANLSLDLKEKKANWTNRKIDLEKKITYYKNFKLSNDPKVALEQIKNSKKDYDFTKQEILTFQQDIDSYNKKITELKNSIKNDTESLKNYASIPNLDIKQEFNQILLSYVKSEFSEYLIMINESKNKIPKEVSDKIQDKIKQAVKKTPEERSEIEIAQKKYNRVIKFPKSGGFPLFWLKKADLNLKKENVFELNFNLKNISTSPSTINLFPKGEINLYGEGISIKKLQLTGELKKDYKIYTIGTIGPILKNKLNFINSKEFSWSILNASDTTTVNGIFDTNTLNLEFKKIFNNYKTEILTTTDKLNNVLLPAFSSLKNIDLLIKINGDYNSPSISLKSESPNELGKNIEAEVKSYLKKEIGHQKNKATEKIKGQIEELEKMYKDEKDKLLKNLKLSSIDFNRLKDDLLKKNIKKIDLKKGLEKIDLKKNLKKLF